MFLRCLPNFITLLRIVGSIAMLFLEPLSVAFFAVYSLCGASDALDGLVARMTKNESELGSRLDSISDMTFYAVMLFRVLPVLAEILPEIIWYFVGAIILLRCVAYITAAVKYKLFASQHTYLNKLTGLTIFAVPYLLPTPAGVAACIAVCVVAALAAGEELFIHVKQKSYNPEIKTVFMREAK